MLTDFSIHSLIGEAAQVLDEELEEEEADDEEQIDVERQAEEETQVNRLGPTHLARASAQRKFRPKNFTCPACKMAFSNNGQLKNHVRIHTGERPFRCAHHDCNKTFTRNEELTRHKLIHTGVRPHACAMCGKRFGRKDHLKKHERTHDRKRMRRKVFEHAGAFQLGHENMFSPAKHAEPAPCQALPPSTTCLLPVSTAATTVASASPAAPAAHLVATMPPGAASPAASASPLSLSPSSHPMISSAGLHAPSSTASTLQQLASEWYKLLGFYQYQQPQFHHHHHHTHNQDAERLG